MKKYIKSYLILILLLCVTINFASAQWIKVGNDIDGLNQIDRSGYSVSLNSDGSIIAIGAIQNNANNNAGYVRIFENSDGSWIQLGSDIIGESANDWFGYSLSINAQGNIVAIGAIQNGGNGYLSGHVRVFEYLGGVWTQMGVDIDGESASDDCGSSVSLSSDGSILAIGSYTNSNNGSLAGQTRIFKYIGGNWVQLGNDINGEDIDDRLGCAVSLSSDGSIVAIGARNNDGNGTNAGHVRIFEYVEGSWIQIGNDIEGEAANDESGYSISLSSNGRIIAIGARYNDGNGTDSGHVRIYEYDGNSWIQMGIDIDGETAEDQSGHQISLNADGNIVAIGARYNDGNGTESGHVRVYKFIGGSWIQVGSDIDGEAAGDGSGFSVSLSSSGSIVAVGGPYNDDGEIIDSGHARVYTNSTLRITEFSSKNIAYVYPNPTSDQLNIEMLSHPIKSIEFSDIYGSLLFRGEYSNENTAQLDLTTYRNGVYFLTIQTQDFKIINKIIKK